MAVNFKVKEFSCASADCGYSTPTLEKLILHMRSHSVFEVAKVCNFEVNNLQQMTFALENGKYTCTACSLLVADAMLFFEHIRHHFTRFPYKCGVCNRRMRSIPYLRKHFSEMHAACPCKLLINETDNCTIEKIMKKLKFGKLHSVKFPVITSTVNNSAIDISQVSEQRICDTQLLKVVSDTSLSSSCQSVTQQSVTLLKYPEETCRPPEITLEESIDKNHSPSIIVPLENIVRTSQVAATCSTTMTKTVREADQNVADSHSNKHLINESFGRYLFCDGKYSCRSCDFNVADQALFHYHVWKHVHAQSSPDIPRKCGCTSSVSNMSSCLTVSLLVKILKAKAFSNVGLQKSNETSLNTRCSTASLETSLEARDLPISTLDTLNFKRLRRNSGSVEMQCYPATSTVENTPRLLVLPSVSTDIKHGVGDMNMIQSVIGGTTAHWKHEVGKTIPLSTPSVGNDKPVPTHLGKQSAPVPHVTNVRVNGTNVHALNSASTRAQTVNQGGASPQIRRDTVSQNRADLGPNEVDSNDFIQIAYRPTPLSEKCSKCSFTCNNTKQLSGHEVLCGKEPVKDFDYVCNECKYCTNYKEIFTWHIVHHVNERTVSFFTCSLCKKESSRRQCIIAHIAVAHPSDTLCKLVIHSETPRYLENIVRCPVCPDAMAWRVVDTKTGKFHNLFLKHLINHKLDNLLAYITRHYNCMQPFPPKVLQFPRSLLGELLPVGVPTLASGPTIVPTSSVAGSHPAVNAHPLSGALAVTIQPLSGSTGVNTVSMKAKKVRKPKSKKAQFTKKKKGTLLALDPAPSPVVIHRFHCELCDFSAVDFLSLQSHVCDNAPQPIVDNTAISIPSYAVLEDINDGHSRIPNVYNVPIGGRTIVSLGNHNQIHCTIVRPLYEAPDLPVRLNSSNSGNLGSFNNGNDYEPLLMSSDTNSFKIISVTSLKVPSTLQSLLADPVHVSPLLSPSPSCIIHHKPQSVIPPTPPIIIPTTPPPVIPPMPRNVIPPTPSLVIPPTPPLVISPTPPPVTPLNPAGLPLHSCALCAFRGSNTSAYAQHKKEHVEFANLRYGYKCGACAFVNPIVAQVKSHVRRFHSEDPEQKAILRISNYNEVPWNGEKVVAADGANVLTVEEREMAKMEHDRNYRSMTSKFKIKYPTTKKSKPITPTSEKFPIKRPHGDISLVEFERNLPNKSVFDRCIVCPRCTFESLKRADLILHLKLHDVDADDGLVRQKAKVGLLNSSALSGTQSALSFTLYNKPIATIDKPNEPQVSNSEDAAHLKDAVTPRSVPQVTPPSTFDDVTHRSIPSLTPPTTPATKKSLAKVDSPPSSSKEKPVETFSTQNKLPRYTCVYCHNYTPTKFLRLTKNHIMNVHLKQHIYTCPKNCGYGTNGNVSHVRLHCLKVHKETILLVDCNSSQVDRILAVENRKGTMVVAYCGEGDIPILRLADIPKNAIGTTQDVAEDSQEMEVEGTDAILSAKKGSSVISSIKPDVSVSMSAIKEPAVKELDIYGATLTTAKKTNSTRGGSLDEEKSVNQNGDAKGLVKQNVQADDQPKPKKVPNIKGIKHSDKLSRWTQSSYPRGDSTAAASASSGNQPITWSTGADISPKTSSSAALPAEPDYKLAFSKFSTMAQSTVTKKLGDLGGNNGALKDILQEVTGASSPPETTHYRPGQHRQVPAAATVTSDNNREDSLNSVRVARDQNIMSVKDSRQSVDIHFPVSSALNLIEPGLGSNLSGALSGIIKKMVNDAAASVGGAAAAAHVNSPDRAAVHPAAEQRGGRRVSNKIGRYLYEDGNYSASESDSTLSRTSAAKADTVGKSSLRKNNSSRGPSGAKLKSRKHTTEQTSRDDASHNRLSGQFNSTKRSEKEYRSRSPQSSVSSRHRSASPIVLNSSRSRSPSAEKLKSQKCKPKTKCKQEPKQESFDYREDRRKYSDDRTSGKLESKKRSSPVYPRSRSPQSSESSRQRYSSPADSSSSLRTDGGQRRDARSLTRKRERSPWKPYEPPKHFTCHICSFQTRDQNSFARHMYREFHKQEFEEPLKDEFNEHAKTHRFLTNKPFSCSYCQFSAFKRSTIKNHQLSKHPNQPELIKSVPEDTLVQGATAATAVNRNDENSGDKFGKEVFRKSVSFLPVISLSDVYLTSRKRLKTLLDKYDLDKIILWK